MKTSKSSGTFRPFEKLKELLEKKSLNPAPFCADGHTKGEPGNGANQNHAYRSEDDTEVNSEIENEIKLFLEAMADVKPITGRDRMTHHFRSPPPVDAGNSSENETLRRLNSLIKTGEGKLDVLRNRQLWIENEKYMFHGIGYVTVGMYDGL